MGWRILDTSASECSTDDVGNGHSRSEEAEGSLCAEKHTVNGDLWTCVFYVVQNRISCILR